MGSTVIRWLALLPAQSGWDLLSVELCVFVFPFVDPFQIFQQKNPTNSITPNTVSGVRLTGDSELALGVNMSAKCCLSLC